jgi:hypothetical protein
MEVGFFLGNKRSLEDKIEYITEIDSDILRGGDPSSCSVAQRMSWASERMTTRIEDTAYCLLGLFDVNMPMMYGEGERAFLRLQEEIMKITEDYSLFCWSSVSDDAPSFVTRSLLARSLANFRWPPARTIVEIGFSEIDPISPLDLKSALPRTGINGGDNNQPPTSTARGLRITLPVIQTRETNELIAFLYCLGSVQSLLCVQLRRTADLPRQIWTCH